MLLSDFSCCVKSSPCLLLVSLHLCLVAAGCTDSSRPSSAGAKSETESTAAVESTKVDAPAALPSISEEDFLKAALDGDASIVKRGLRQGIPVDYVAEDKRTALMLAAFNGHASIVKHLLDHKATVDLRDSIQRTALMYASTGTNVETVQLLVDAGANVNAADAEENWTPLMMAAAEGQAEIVSVLLKHGAIVESRDVDGETALQFAASKGHQAVVELLSK